LKQIIQFKKNKKKTPESFTSLSTGEGREQKTTQVRTASCKGDKGASINRLKNLFSKAIVKHACFQMLQVTTDLSTAD